MEIKKEDLKKEEVKVGKVTQISPKELGQTVAKNLATKQEIRKPTDLFNDVITSIVTKNPDYEKAILALMELRDRDQTIIWRIDSSQKAKTGRDIIIRDAREVKYVDPVADKYAYQIQGINHLRGALLLLDQVKDKDKHKKLLETLLQHFIENMNSKKLDPKQIVAEFEHFNTVLVQSLSKALAIPANEVTARLGVAREFANLEIEARDVVTVNKLKDKDDKEVIALQGEIAFTTLTPELIEKYENRKNESWYTNLSDWQQSLVDQSVDNILQENRTLPTQLRKILLGVRNAFDNVSGIIDAKGHFVDVNDSPHSGTIAYYSKDSDVNQEMANLHARQLMTLHFIRHLITLNSPTNPSGDDKKIVKESERAMKAIEGFYSNLPLNWLRRITPNVYTGIHELLQEVSEELLDPVFKEIKEKNIKLPHPDLMKNIQDYLNPEKSHFAPSEDVLINTIASSLDALMKELPADSEMRHKIDVINLAMKISYLTRHNVNISDAKNQNLFIGALSNILDSQLATILGEQHLRTSSACQSGKDRDGILIFTTDLLNFLHHINGLYQTSSADKTTDKNNKENIIRLAQGGHAQFMAGFLGGTLAAFGIKSDSLGAIPVELFPAEVSKVLILPTAQLNKKVLTDEKLPLDKQVYYSSDLNDLASQIRLILNALEMQIMSQQVKVTPQETKKVFGGLFFSKEITSNQLTQLKLLKDDLDNQLKDLENSKDPRFDLVREKVSDTLQFIRTLYKGSFSKEGTTVHLLQEIDQHLQHLENLGRPFPKGS